MLFRQTAYRESIPYFDKAGALVNSDYYNPTMLMTCYHGNRRCEGSSGRRD